MKPPVSEMSGPGARRLRRAGCLMAMAVLGGLAGLVGVALWQGPARLPPLTPERFREMKDRWAAHGPRHYDLEVRVQGRQPATYFVSVRDGRAQTALRNGRPLTQSRTLGTWSVPGMFATMQTDVEHLEQHQQGSAEPDTPQLKLRAAFDPELGIPLRYHRTELKRLGTNPEVSWEVIRFTPEP